MLGTGVNAQRRAVAIHHFDIPWKPSEMEQRNGRVSRPGNVIAKEFAGNKVGCFIYATENTLDTYKFNILQNKQMFINQMKRGSLNLRTIDEGAMDDSGTMNFAEYVAIMSGNNDLLEKTRIEKIIMSLENERKVFNKSRAETERKLEYKQYTLENWKRKIAGFTDDWNYFNEAAPKDNKGKRPNPVVLDVIETSSAKEMGERLQKIEKDTDTTGLLMKIGTLYRFDLAVRTYTFRDKNEKTQKYNMFYVVGKNKQEYVHHNGLLAKTPEVAARYFISALENLPRHIEEAQRNIDNFENDIPVLLKILEGTWNNAPKLHHLKSELAALDRKIMATLSSIEN